MLYTAKMMGIKIFIALNTFIKKVRMEELKVKHQKTNSRANLKEKELGNRKNIVIQINIIKTDKQAHVETS